MSCNYCEDPGQQVETRLPDDSELCHKCHAQLRRQTAGFPNCPTCKHRFYMVKEGEWGYRCLGCSGKFPKGVLGAESAEPSYAEQLSAQRANEDYSRGDQ